jgi:opacity protein-like surface antigen
MKATALAAAATAAALASTPALAQDWYVRGDVSANFNTRLDSSPPLRGHDGWGLDVGVGRDLGSGFRADGEVVYLKSEGRDGLSDHQKAVGGFLNGYYDFNKDGALQPFVGAGVGVAHVNIDGGPYRGHDTGFAYQAKAGLGYRFSDRLTGEVAYRYLGAPDLRVGDNPFEAKGDFRAQTVSVGLRYKLG